jgi:hypothetical protein
VHVTALMNKLSWFFFDKYPSEAADVMVSIPTITRIAQALVRHCVCSAAGSARASHPPLSPLPLPLPPITLHNIVTRVQGVKLWQ